MKTLISPDIWRDPSFEELSPEAKLVVFWLWTNADLAGVVRVSERRLGFDTGITSPSEALAEGLASGSYEVDGDRVVIINFISRQIGEGEKLARNNIARSLMKVIASQPLSTQSFIMARYPELKPLLRAPEGVPKGKGKGKGTGKGTGTGKGRGTMDEIKAYAVERGLAPTDGEWFFDKAEGCGWKNNGKAIVCWKATVRAWQKIKIFPSQKNPNGSAPGGAMNNTPEARAERERALREDVLRI